MITTTISYHLLQFDRHYFPSSSDDTTVTQQARLLVWITMKTKHSPQWMQFTNQSWCWLVKWMKKERKIWSRLLQQPVPIGNGGRTPSQHTLSYSCLNKADEVQLFFTWQLPLQKEITFSFLLDLKEWICAGVPALLRERWRVLHSPALLRFEMLGL